MDSVGERQGLSSFLLLERHRYQLVSRGKRFRRPSRRYEDLCLAAEICRAQHHYLATTAESAPSTDRSLLGGVNLQLMRLDADVDRARRWLRSAACRKAEARAAERFEAIALEERPQVPARRISEDAAKPVSSPWLQEVISRHASLSGKIHAYPGRPQKLKRVAHRRPAVGGINARAAWAVGAAALAVASALVWSSLPLNEDSQLGSNVVGDEAVAPPASAPRAQADDPSPGRRRDDSREGDRPQGRGERSEDVADGGTIEPPSAGASPGDTASLVVAAPAPATAPPTPDADPTGEDGGGAPDSSDGPTGGGGGQAAGVRDELYDRMLGSP